MQPLMKTIQISSRFPAATAAFFCAGFLALYLPAAQAWERTGSVQLEATAFQQDGAFTDQDYRSNFSLALQQEFYHDWNNGNDSVVITPFARFDGRDRERSHADLRELLYTRVHNNLEFRAGLGKVFWGVTEFNHLVDIINQTDFVDSLDGEEKLGQPMLAASAATDQGIFDVYVLPGFRERTFPGEDGRLRFEQVVDTDKARYEADDKDRHIDIALRWSHSFSVFDLGVFGFRGTDRDPLLQPVFKSGEVVLQPFYQQSTQWGIDLQATVDSWLVKWESLYKSSKDDDYAAVQAGVEYTFYGIGGGNKDVGLLLEYGWDERGKKAASIAQNDLYFGSRIALNDTSDTTLLVGGSYDLDYQTRSYLLEASRRLSDSWTIDLNANFFVKSKSEDVLSALDKDDYLRLTLERFF